MKRDRACLCIVIFAIWLTAPATAQAQGCKANAVMVRQAPVYAKPATEFNTANGWVYASPVAVLGSNLKVFVCTERTVRFGVISQAWTQIAYWGGKSWQYGWVVSDSIRLTGLDPATWLASVAQWAFLVPSAQAQPQVITDGPPPGAEAPPPPQAPSAGATGNADGSAVAAFYGVLFACMVLGMLAKIFFDTLTGQKQVNWRARARAGVLPILVSPIVFLGIMQAADATAAATLASFIAVSCTAFQNGFFWHAVLDRAK